MRGDLQAVAERQNIGSIGIGIPGTIAATNQLHLENRCGGANCCGDRECPTGRSGALPPLETSESSVPRWVVAHSRLRVQIPRRVQVPVQVIPVQVRVDQVWSRATLRSVDSIPPANTADRRRIPPARRANKCCSSRSIPAGQDNIGSKRGAYRGSWERSRPGRRLGSPASRSIASFERDI